MARFSFAKLASPALAVILETHVAARAADEPHRPTQPPDSIVIPAPRETG